MIFSFNGYSANRLSFKNVGSVNVFKNEMMSFLFCVVNEIPPTNKGSSVEDGAIDEL
jgi:hypothetical protein